MRRHSRQVGEESRNLKQTGIDSMTWEVYRCFRKMCAGVPRTTSEKTYIMTKKKYLPSHKPMKNMLTLLLCASVNGNYKINPLLVYHSEHPPIFIVFC